MNSDTKPFLESPDPGDELLDLWGSLVDLFTRERFGLPSVLRSWFLREDGSVVRKVAKRPYVLVFPISIVYDESLNVPQSSFKGSGQERHQDKVIVERCLLVDDALGFFLVLSH